MPKRTDDTTPKADKLRTERPSERLTVYVDSETSTALRQLAAIPPRRSLSELAEEAIKQFITRNKKGAKNP